jgi:hypothetical protein
MTGPASRLRIVLTSLAVIALAACSGQPRSGSGGPEQTEATPPPHASALRAERPRRTWTVADLMGADTVKVDGILGPPDTVRQEGAGEMRIYRNSSCVVHVFLFPRADQLYTTHVEARANATRLDARKAGACISSFS